MSQVSISRTTLQFCIKWSINQHSCGLSFTAQDQTSSPQTSEIYLLSSWVCLKKRKKKIGVVFWNHRDCLPLWHVSTFYCSVNNMSLFLRALSSGQCVLQRSNIQLLAPVLAPEKVVCVGMNYRDHCVEQDVPIPSEPIIFNKFPNAITGPYDDILLPSQSQVRAAGDEIKNKKIQSFFQTSKGVVSLGSELHQC